MKSARTASTYRLTWSLSLTANNCARLTWLLGRSTTIFESPEPIESPGVATVSSWSGRHLVREQPVLVRTTQHIYALDRSHKVVRQFAIPNEVDPKLAVSWYEIPAGQAIAIFSEWSTGHNFLFRIGADGAILERTEVELQRGGGRRNVAGEQVLLSLACRRQRSSRSSGPGL